MLLKSTLRLYYSDSSKCYVIAKTGFLKKRSKNYYFILLFWPLSYYHKYGRFMRRTVLTRVFSLIIFSGIIFLGNLVFTQSAFSATSLLPGKSTTVSATIGSYYLTISGYVAPYASVVLLSNDYALKSAVADANGYFTISNIIVTKGFSKFCVDAVDVKRLGDSYTCINIPPMSGDYQKTNVFLPPTLGVQRSEVKVGDNAVIWGYSMPGAKVVVHLSDGRSVTTTADPSGYYEVHVRMDKAGEYELFADATYHNAASLKPDRTTSLMALSTGEQLVKQGGSLLDKILKFLIGNPWGLLFVIIPLLLLIVWLLRKAYPRMYTTIEEEFSEFAQHVPFVPHRLHHWWMKDVGF